jgi:hypothetical protein
MSFKATLTIENKDFDVLECISEVEQKIDARGRAISNIKGGDIRLVLRASADDTIPAWALDPEKKYGGTITFFKMDMESKFREIEFGNGYVTWFAEAFMSRQGDENFNEAMVFQDDLDREMFAMLKKAQAQFGTDYLMLCKITAEKIKIDDVKHDNHW